MSKGLSYGKCVQISESLLSFFKLIVITYSSLISALISDSARIIFTPGNHWSGRFPPLDRNKALWGSWLVVGSKGKVIYPKYYKNIINLVLLLPLGRLGHQGSTENSCNFATFEGVFFIFLCTK